MTQRTAENSEGDLPSGRSGAYVRARPSDAGIRSARRDEQQVKDDSDSEPLACASGFCIARPDARAFSSLVVFPLPLAVIQVLVLLLSILGSSVSAAEPTEEEKQIDIAISRALEHLASKQQANGSWTFESGQEVTAATSLAIMAFLAAGHVPGEGPYDQPLQRGIRFILEKQQANGLLASTNAHGTMYAHGISTLMLAEVAGMTDDALANRCREALSKAVRVILASQSVRKNEPNAGGWRYQINSNDSDLSVTGWQLLALRAAKNLGCDVPAEPIDAAVAYVNRCATRGNRGFGYQPGHGPTPTMTGTGILCLEICGVHHSDAALGGAQFLQQAPLRPDQEWFFYGVYYSTIGMFQVGGDSWGRVKKHLIPMVLNLQAENGSWTGRVGQEKAQGTVYATSLAVLALSAEYQFLPIYQR